MSSQRWACCNHQQPGALPDVPASDSLRTLPVSQALQHGHSLLCRSEHDACMIAGSRPGSATGAAEAASGRASTGSRPGSSAGAAARSSAAGEKPKPGTLASCQLHTCWNELHHGNHMLFQCACMLPSRADAAYASCTQVLKHLIS